ncbi:hypothetical protein M9H77_02669 [Catharanthus roseus]|uniref:Uncharacterized protein n=1 Tax=Catharanthus roseus TaxID=4058 RepID=A0ACC0C945_CATRO|nr:hypothetical protein M9H77_02669 [Catharanthus roseus]
MYVDPSEPRDYGIHDSPWILLLDMASFRMHMRYWRRLLSPTRIIHYRGIVAEKRTVIILSKLAGALRYSLDYGSCPLSKKKFPPSNLRSRVGMRKKVLSKIIHQRQ